MNGQQIVRELTPIATRAIGGPLDGDEILRHPDHDYVRYVQGPWAYGYRLEGGALVATGERWLDDEAIAAEVDCFEPAFREEAELWAEAS